MALSLERGLLNTNSMKGKLKDILMLIKWSTVSTDYFGKSRTWIYQRISGYDVNGKAAEFSATERERLREALHDIAARINAAADNI